MKLLAIFAMVAIVGTEGVALMKSISARSLAAAGVPDPLCKTGIFSLKEKGKPQSCCAGYCGECTDYPTCEKVRGQDSKNACCASAVYDMRCGGGAAANKCLKKCSEAVPPCIMDIDEIKIKSPDRNAADDCTEAVATWRQRAETAIIPPTTTTKKPPPPAKEEAPQEDKEEGQLRQKYDDLCLDYNYNDKNVFMHGCHSGKNQHWFFDSKGRLKTKYDDKCLDYNYNNKNVFMHDCHDGNNQKWLFDKKGRLLTMHDDRCLDYNYNNKNVFMHPCHDGKNQKWFFD
jgi:hypothetical protein